ncbi:MAG: VWA domain-containing protein [Anaerolineae bacterium]|nr:VWA domain-containing protein [Anaerolineae bacterium]
MRRAVIVLLAVFLAALSLGVAPAAQPRRIALVIDVSASMADAANGATKIEVTRQAVTAMLRFFAQATPIPRVTVIAFSDDPTLLYPLSNNMDAAAGAVAALPDLVEGGTNIGAALEAALNALGDASEDDAEDGAIVLMTDGAPTQGLDAAQVIDGPARAAREQGHCFYTLGLGDFDAAFLESLRAVAPCPSRRASSRWRIRRACCGPSRRLPTPPPAARR